jgi:hypothetical protein
MDLNTVLYIITCDQNYNGSSFPRGKGIVSHILSHEEYFIGDCESSKIQWNHCIT